MKFTATQSDFAKALATISRAIPSRGQGHPILTHVLINAGVSGVTLSGFDLRLGIKTTIAAGVERAGDTTVPAKLLSDIVTKQPAEALLTITEEAGSLLIATPSGSYNIRTAPASDYPEIDVIRGAEEQEVDASLLGAGLRAVHYAASSDETKQVLCGVHLKQAEGSLWFAATDGHRLAVDVFPSDVEVPEGGIVIPIKACQDIEAIAKSQDCETAILAIDRGLLMVKLGSTQVSTRLIDGQYPNYNQLIPTQFNRKVTVDSKVIKSALERVAILADQKNNVVKLKLVPNSQEVIISAEAQDVGSGVESIAAQIQGEILVVAFNSKYLAAAIASVQTPELQISLNSDTSPATITPLGGNAIALVMPVQIRS